MYLLYLRIAGSEFNKIRSFFICSSLTFSGNPDIMYDITNVAVETALKASQNVFMRHLKKYWNFLRNFL